MTTNISLSYAAHYGTRFEEFIVTATAEGFDGVQLIPDQSPNLIHSLTTERRDSITALLQRHDISSSVHNVFYDINPVSVVPEVRSCALSISEDVFRFAADINAESVTIHPGYMFPGWRTSEAQTKAFWDNARVAIRQLANLASDYDVTPLFENGSYHLTTRSGTERTPLHIAIDPNGLEKILTFAGEQAGVSLDIGKVYYSDHLLSDFTDRLGDRIGELQLSSLAVANRSEDFLEKYIVDYPGRIVLEGTQSECLKLRDWIYAFHS